LLKKARGTNGYSRKCWVSGWGGEKPTTAKKKVPIKTGDPASHNKTRPLGFKDMGKKKKNCPFGGGVHLTKRAERKYHLIQRKWIIIKRKS